MAKLSNLQEAFVEALQDCLDPGSIRETGRRLKEAGLIRKGLRGRYGGTEMTSEDATSYMAALLGGGDRRNVLEAARTAERTMALVFDQALVLEGEPIKLKDDVFRFGLPRRHTFGELLRAIIDASSYTWDGSAPDRLKVTRHQLAIYPLLVPALEVSVHWPWPSADVKIWCGVKVYSLHYIYKDTESGKIDIYNVMENYERLHKKFGSTRENYRVTRTVTADLFRAVGECLKFDKVTRHG